MSFEKGYKYVGYIPTDITPHGKIAEMDLIFEIDQQPHSTKECDRMKKLIALLLAMVLLLTLVACGNKLVEGSEKTYYGTVTDRAMSVVNEGDRQGRAYISITTDNEDIQFWLTKDCETNAKIGDKVTVESAIEEQTNLLVATSITVE